MEHKLITGGEQWLPFARSRIKALRATGLAYASQKFEVEGALIDVRIEPGHEHIRIEGGDPEAYLESGQLNWLFHAQDDPKWAEPATWKFTGIATTSTYLGRIIAGGSDVGKQKNDPALSEGQYSLAIGYPKAKTGSVPERETKDAQTEKDYKDVTLAKKGIMSMYPSSIFSGKMRLFMQCLYGAKAPQKKEDLPFLFDDTLDMPVGMFVGRGPSGGGMLRVRPESMGIFTAPDNTYWLLDINSGPGKVLVNKINTDAVQGLVKALDKGADREKTEAYIFASSYVEISSEQRKQLWANGSFTMPPGSELAYGWKWNTTGSKASIVVHEMRGETILTTRLHAHTVHLTFTYATVDDKTKCPISVSAAVEDHGDWIDGWGEYNIFVPESPTVIAPLDLFSVRAGSGLIPPLIPFENIPIYGYYVNDVWTPVVLSAYMDSWSETNSSVSNIYYANGATYPHTSNPLDNGAVNGAGGWAATWLTTQYGPGRKVSFDGVTVDGRHKNFNGQDDWGSGTPTDDNTPNSSTYYLAQWLSSDAGPGYPPSAFYSAVMSHRGDDVIYQRPLWGNTTRGRITVSGSGVTIFAIVIPAGDAEALYIPRKVVDMRVRTQVVQSYYTECGFHVFGYNTATQTEIPYEDGLGWWVPGAFVADGTTSLWDNGTPSSGPPATSVTSSIPPEPDAVDVVCFNRKEHGLSSTPGGSYAALFDVDYNYPYYDRGMYTFTSHGGRYIMSEKDGGPRKNPASVEGNRFVGWA